MNLGKPILKSKPPTSLEDYLVLNYTVTIYEEEGGGYTALIEDLPGCITYGETIEESLNMINDARILWLTTAYQHGDPIPLPSKPYT